MILTCKDVISENPTTLLPTDTLSKAFNLMRKKGMRYLPVVSADGKFLGVFTSPTLIKLMLPRAVTIHIGGKDSSKGLNDLNFLNIDKKDFCDSIKNIKDELVQEHISDPKNIPIASPETSLIEGILLIHKFKRHLILVEPDSNKFVGIVSINSTLKKVFDDDFQL